MKLDVSEAEIDRLLTVSLDHDVHVGITVDQNAVEIATGHREAGNRSMAVGKFDEACESFTRALQLSGLIPEELTGAIYLGRCSAWQSVNKPQLALQDATHAARLLPSSYKVYLKLAQIHESMNEYRLACADYERAKALAPNEMKSSIADKLSNCRAEGDKWDRQEHANLQYSATSLVVGAGRTDVMNASLGGLSKPDGTPIRDWDLPASVIEQFPLGTRLVVRAKQACCDLRETEAFKLYLQAAALNVN